MPSPTLPQVVGVKPTCCHICRKPMDSRYLRTCYFCSTVGCDNCADIQIVPDPSAGSVFACRKCRDKKHLTAIDPNAAPLSSYE